MRDNACVTGNPLNRLQHFPPNQSTRWISPDMSQPPRLLDEVRKAIRVRHYSYRTEKVYVDWIRRFVIFHGKQHPMLMGGVEVEKFLSHLARDRNVSAATQGQALAALLFLYKRVLNVDLPWIENVIRASRPKRLPTVLSLKRLPHEAITLSEVDSHRTSVELTFIDEPPVPCIEAIASMIADGEQLAGWND